MLVAHSHLEWRQHLNGHTGVTIFFVISGFIITTMLTREESERGRADLGGFYIRRVFRLLPLYALALAVTSIAVAAGLAEDAGNYGSRLVLFLTGLNEFAPDGTFGHSWSLAVEEKFYFLWPLLGFATAASVRWRLSVAFALLTATSLIGAVWGWAGYVGVYSPILAGCVLALLATNKHYYGQLERLARPRIGIVIGLVCAALIAVAPDGHVQVWVGLAFALLLPQLLLTESRARSVLSLPVMVWAGKRAYAVYLFHPLVGSAVDIALPQGSGFGLVHLAAMTACSFAMAEVLFRLVEQPCIRIGREIANRRLESRRTAEAAEVP